VIALSVDITASNGSEAPGWHIDRDGKKNICKVFVALN
jgi:hypothetical protein